MDLLRNQDEKNSCRERDNYQCILTHTSDPQICHVFPFSAKNNLGGTWLALQALGKLWAPEWLATCGQLLTNFDHPSDISDKCPNMVALSATAHDYWTRAYLGFEPVQKFEDGLQLSVQWLKSTNWNAEIGNFPLYTNPEDHLKDREPSGGLISLIDAENHRPIFTGNCIEIKSAKKEQQPSFALWQLQWDLIRMACLCGRGEDLEEDWDSDDDNPFSIGVSAFDPGETQEFGERATAQSGDCDDDDDDDDDDPFKL